jgi:glycosyltransferase involved in cell wall biosynthesis
VLIGECKADVTELQQLDNVFLLGRRRYEDLPGYCAAFDAALLPFVMNGMTRSVNPVKLYEYLAAGLPVVSTPLPEARRYDGPVTVVNTAEGFAAACDRILSSDHPGRREAISRIVEDESWLSKAETLSNLIMYGRTPHESTGPIGQPTGRTCAGVL